MFKKTRGRLSPREIIENHNAADRYWAASFGKEPLFQRPVPPKRDRIKRSDGTPAHPLEKEVLAAVLQVLRNDPRIHVVDRRQSGVFQDGDRYIRVGQKGVLDISGMLRGGRYFEIECKRQGEKPDERQKARIEYIKNGGGISGYCWSVESALALFT